jgi:hypothetical protein
MFVCKACVIAWRELKFEVVDIHGWVGGGDALGIASAGCFGRWGVTRDSITLLPVDILH